MPDIKKFTRRIRQGDIYYVDLGEADGKCVQRGYRPVIIYQNDIGNKYSPVVNAYCITKASNNKSPVPTHVRIGKEAGLKEESIILVEQPVTIDKSDLKEYVGRCTEETLKEIWKASAIQHGKIKPKFEMEHVLQLINKIKELDDFIDRFKYKYDLKEELFERSLLLAEIIKYCSDYNVDYRTILIEHGIVTEQQAKKIAV